MTTSATSIATSAPEKTYTETGRRRRGAVIAVLACLALLAVWFFRPGGAGTAWVTSLLFPTSDDQYLFQVEPRTLSITLTEDGELKPLESVQLKCEVEGEATIRYVVPESRRVSKGDLLVELTSDSIVERLEKEVIELEKNRAEYEAAVQDLEITLSENQSNIKKVEADLEVARLDLQKYLQGDFPKARKQIELDISRAEADRKRVNEDLERNRRWFEKDYVSQSKLDDLKFELDNIDRTLDMNHLAMDTLLNYEKPKMEKQKRSAVEQAEQELIRERARAESRRRSAQAKVSEQQALLDMRERRVERIRQQLDYTKIHAPVDGVVQYPGGDRGWRGDDRRIAIGENVREGQTLIVLPNTSQMLVETRVHEADRHLIKEGLPCIVRVPAAPNDVLTGRVKSVARFADTANRWLNPNLKEHTTEILLDDTDAHVSPGDSAEVQILIDEVPDVLAVPVQTVFVRGDRRFVFVNDGGDVQPVEISTGRSSAELIEVTDGLSRGASVLMHVDEELLATLPVPNAQKSQPESPVAKVGGAASQTDAEEG